MVYMLALSANFIVHKDFSHIRPALQSLFATTQTPCEVHVIINTSHELEEKALRDGFPQVQFFVNSIPLGFAANHNQFMRHVTSEFMALLNDDIMLHPGALDTLLDYMTSHPQVGVVGANLQNADGTPQVSVYSDPTLTRMIYKISGLAVLTRQNSWLRKGLTRLGIARFLRVESLQPQSVTRNVPVVKGAVMVVRREAYLQVGPMDEVTLGYGEEIDWHLRMREAGWQVAFVSEAHITHFGLGQARLQLQGQMLIEDRKAILNYWIKHRPAWQVRIIRFTMIVSHVIWSLVWAILLQIPKAKTHFRIALLGVRWHP